MTPTERNKAVVLNWQAIGNLAKVKERFDTIVESIELMIDLSFMNAWLCRKVK